MKILVSALYLFFFLSYQAFTQQEYIDKFQKCQLIQDDHILLYSIFSPENQDHSKKYPLILAHHGMENQFVSPGDFMKRAASITWGWATPLVQQDNPCFVLAPHFTQRGNSSNVLGGWQTPGAIEAVSHIIDSLIEIGRVDENRVYITGHSFGGGATWAYPLYLKNYFAAMVPTSYVLADPNINSDQAKSLYAEIPIWSVLHRDDAPIGRWHPFLQSLDISFTKTDYFGNEEILLSNERIENLVEVQEQYFHTEYGYPCGGPKEIDCHFAMDSVVQDRILHQWLFQQYKQDSNAISLTLLEQGESVSVNWSTTNKQDKVVLWLLPKAGENWVLLYEGVAEIGRYNLPITSIRDAGSARLRILIKNKEGFVYGRDEKAISNHLDIPLSTKSGALSLFPNPASDILTLRNSKPHEIQVFDLAGSRVEVEILERTPLETTLDVSSLARGTYFLKIGHLTYRVLKE